MEDVKYVRRALERAVAMLDAETERHRKACHVITRFHSGREAYDVVVWVAHDDAIAEDRERCAGCAVTCGNAHPLTEICQGCGH